MPTLKHSIKDLPGEQLWRQFINDNEKNYQSEYRFYQEWRMKMGLPMDDIDCIISDEVEESFNKMRNLEYDYGMDGMINIYASLEMKHFRTPNSVIQRILTKPSANRAFADLAQRPFFMVKYWPEQENGVWEFTVYPVNSYAKDILPVTTHMSEQEYLEFMYTGLRNQPVPIKLYNSSSQITNHVNP